MAKQLHLKALEVEQPGLKGKNVYVTVIKASDLIDESMFKVDVWKPSLAGKKEQGYQRAIYDRHASGIADYLSQESSMLPDSILISLRDETPRFENGKIVIDHFPAYIVDGQHRVAGLRKAIMENNEMKWADAELSVVLLCGFPKLDEMVQFMEINTKAKKVHTDLALQLMSDLATKDKSWNSHFVKEGTDWKVRSAKLVNELNALPNTFWFNAIKMPGEKKNPKAVASLNSFVTSLKPIVTHTFANSRDVDTNIRIICNYWDALRAIFADAFINPKSYAIQKTPGLFTLHALLEAILNRKGYDFGSKAREMQQLLVKIFENTEDGPIDTDFWRSDNRSGVTMYGSMKGFRILANTLIESLQVVDK